MQPLTLLLVLYFIFCEQRGLNMYTFTYLIGYVHWDIFPIDALRNDLEISYTSGLEELFNVFALKEIFHQCNLQCSYESKLKVSYLPLANYISMCSLFLVR